MRAPKTSQLYQIKVQKLKAELRYTLRESSRWYHLSAMIQKYERLTGAKQHHRTVTA